MSWPAFSTLELERDGAVTWLRLNRPARFNALTEEGCAELGAAIRVLAADADTRVLVLTGNGRGFCAGADVAGLEERLSWGLTRQIGRFERMAREIVLGLHELSVPTIAAINGAASGGGLSLALACDLRVIAADATITFGFTGVGLIPDLGATYFLPRLIGLPQACRLLWTNRRLSAEQALAVGLVDEISAAGELAGQVTALARQIAAAPQLAVRLGRAAMRAALHGTLAEALDTEGLAQSLCLQSADHQQRVRAFLQRPAGQNRAAAIE
ncbi:MAG: enoyl-CoA hydratase/isomerase family protein [Deltaproteobacteria bacterium]|nr:enoyl-CoA hydratase/isomerase family protein [Deltaproteobacteria bacterium]